MTVLGLVHAVCLCSVESEFRESTACQAGKHWPPSCKPDNENNVELARELAASCFYFLFVFAPFFFFCDTFLNQMSHCIMERHEEPHDG